MSAQSDYGVALVETLIVPIMNADGRNVFASNDPETAAGDVIAYLLHWVEAQYPKSDDEDYEGETLAEFALSNGERHWQAERGDGDDIAQGSEDYYRGLTEALRRAQTLTTTTTTGDTGQ